MLALEIRAWKTSAAKVEFSCLTTFAGRPVASEDGCPGEGAMQKSQSPESSKSSPPPALSWGHLAAQEVPRAILEKQKRNWRRGSPPSLQLPPFLSVSISSPALQSSGSCPRLAWGSKMERGAYMDCALRGSEEAEESSDPWEPQPTMAKDYQDLPSLDEADQSSKWTGRVRPPAPWQRLCSTGRLLLLLTALCSLLLLSVVLLGIKRAQLDRGQQEARQALESFNLTVTAILGSHRNTTNQTGSKLTALESTLSKLGEGMEKVKVRMENQVDSLQRGSKAFQCDLVEVRSNGSKTGCCPRNWENFRESCYWASVQRLSWDNAKLDCEKKSSHLVILNSPEEKAFVRQRRTSDLWIGLTDASGSWKWVDGTSYTLRPEDWAEHQPDHWYGHGLGGGEDCVHTTNTGLWNDNHCSRRFFWMCEAELQS